MKVRTFAAILFALAAVVAVSYLSTQNSELLTRPFALGSSASVPLYAALILVFLAGFLPAVSVLLVQTLHRDLAARRERRREREAQSLRGSFRRAVDLQVDGQWGRAAAELEAVQAEQPEDFGTLLRYGQVLRSQGRLDEALEAHRRAAVLYPQSTAVLYELALDYAERGEHEVASQIWDRVVRDFPGMGLAVLRRRRSEAVEGEDWPAAARLEERFEALAAEGGAVPDPAERALRRGVAYESAVALLDAGRAAEARSLCDELLAEDPGFRPALLLLGEAALVDGDEGQAVALWRQGFVATGSPAFLQRIEDHYLEREDPLSAIETLHEVIARATDDLLPRYLLGRLYTRLEMHGEALRLLDELDERIGDSPAYYRLLGRLHERRGEMGRAVAALRASLRASGAATAEWVCSLCEARSEHWVDRCALCGEWGTVDLDVPIEETGGPATHRLQPVRDAEGEPL
ncbi:MAG: tetratricopeptide repeat protein [Thermoanaerobaculia bacterium]